MVIAFLFGMFAGVTLGVFATALMIAAGKDKDSHNE